MGERLFIGDINANISLTDSPGGHRGVDESWFKQIDSNAIGGIGGSGGAYKCFKSSFGGRIANGIEMIHGGVCSQHRADQRDAATLAVRIRRLQLHLANAGLKREKGCFQVQPHGSLKAFQRAFSERAVAV